MRSHKTGIESLQTLPALEGRLRAFGHLPAHGEGRPLVPPECCTRQSHQSSEGRGAPPAGGCRALGPQWGPCLHVPLLLCGSRGRTPGPMEPVWPPRSRGTWSGDPRPLLVSPQGSRNLQGGEPGVCRWAQVDSALDNLGAEEVRSRTAAHTGPSLAGGGVLVWGLPATGVGPRSPSRRKRRPRAELTFRKSDTLRSPVSPSS